jgi:ribosomal protein L35
MKTNKSYTKRLRVTKNGKIIGRKPGQNHFNAKESRDSHMDRSRARIMDMNSKDRGRFLPGKSGR